MPIPYENGTAIRPNLCADVSRTGIASGGGAKSYVVSIEVWRFVRVVIMKPSENGLSAPLIRSSPVNTIPAVRLTPERVDLSVNVPPIVPEVWVIWLATWSMVPNR